MCLEHPTHSWDDSLQGLQNDDTPGGTCPLQVFKDETGARWCSPVVGRPHTNTWSEIPSALPPATNAAVLATSAGIMRLGGEGSFGEPLGEFFLLDGDTWIERAGLPAPMSLGRGAAALGGTVWIYDASPDSAVGGLFAYDIASGGVSVIRRSDEPTLRQGAALLGDEAGLHLVGGARAVLTCIKDFD